MDQNTAKRLAAEAALRYVPESGVVGLGSGSTAAYFIQGIARLVSEGRALRGVPTSEESRALASGLGVGLLPDEGPWQIDVCVDGADEVNPALDVIKGGGGCHTREKIVNEAARLNIIIVDESKLCSRLGARAPLPVEVLAFAHAATRQALAKFGNVGLRMAGDAPYRTDSGNLVYDVAIGAIEDPKGLNHRLRAIPGVIETGLFVGRVDRVIVAGPEGIRELVRPEPARAAKH